jgi:hypothetical protein
MHFSRFCNRGITRGKCTEDGFVGWKLPRKWVVILHLKVQRVSLDTVGQLYTLGSQVYNPFWGVDLMGRVCSVLIPRPWYKGSG